MAELHVVASLVAKRAELSGDLERVYESRDALKAHIAHLDAVLRYGCVFLCSVLLPQGVTILD